MVLGVRDYVPMHLYEERESLSFTYFPGPFAFEICIKRVYNIGLIDGLIAPKNF